MKCFGRERKDTNPWKPLALPRNFVIKRVCMRVCLCSRPPLYDRMRESFPFAVADFGVECIAVSLKFFISG